MLIDTEIQNINLQLMPLTSQRAGPASHWYVGQPGLHRPQINLSLANLILRAAHNPFPMCVAVLGPLFTIVK